MHKLLHRSLRVFHSRLSSHASKDITHHFSGKRASLLSATANGSILQRTLASNHTFIRTASIKALERARNLWHSKLNSSPYISSSQKANGWSLRSFERSARPHLRHKYPSQPLSPPLHLRLFHTTARSSLHYLFTRNKLSSTLLYRPSLMPYSESQSSFSM